MNNKKWLWIAAAVVVVIVVLVVVDRDGKPSAEKTTITIGATLPLSGDLAFLGDAYRDAMLMSLADAEKQGNLKYNYKFVFEDDKFDPTTAASTANKLISIDGVEAIASFGSPTGNVVSPIAEAAHVVHFGIASDPNVAKGDYNFVHWTPPYEEAMLLVTEMQKKGIKNVVLFEENQPGVLAVVAPFEKDLAGTDIKIVSDQKFNAGETDFRSLIAKAKANAADMYLLEATSPELEILAKQIRDAGIKTPLTSVESFEFTPTPQLFEGEWYINAADPSLAFVDEFTKEYNMSPKLADGNGYDVVSLLVYAFEHAGNGELKPSEASVQQVLSGITGFKGVMGTLSIDADGIVDTPAVVRMIQNGKPITIGQ